MRQNFFGVVGELTTLPGCTQVGVSHSVFNTGEKGMGLGKKANAARRKEAFENLGYDCLICTVESTNKVQIRVLRRNGWEFITQFTSRKTGHIVEMWACYADSSVGL